MYKKYINKGEKKVGPYFYDSIRLKDGKIKTVYLGRDEKSAKKKANLLKLGISKNVKKRSSATLEKALGTGTNFLHLRPRRYRKVSQKLNYVDGAVFVAIIFLVIFSFNNYGSPIVEDFGFSGKLKTMPFMANLHDSVPGDIKSNVNLITGKAIFSPSFNQGEYVHDIYLLLSNSSEYDMKVSGVNRVVGFKVTGRIAVLKDGAAKVFLSDDISGDTYLVFDSEELKDSGNFFKGISGLAVHDIDNVVDGEVLEGLEISDNVSQEKIKEPSYNELYGLGLIKGFSVIDSVGKKVKYFLSNDTQDRFRVSMKNTVVYEMEFTGDSDGWIAYEEYSSFGLIEPVNVTFETVFGVDVGDENVSNESNFTISAKANGDFLYGCNFWDFELGICLSDWKYLFDINGTKNFTISLTNEVMAFAEGIFDPNKTLEIEDEEIIEEIEEVNVTDVVDPLVEMLKEKEMVGYDISWYESECGTICFVKDFLSGDFTIKLYIKDAILEISRIEVVVIEDDINETAYSIEIRDEFGISIFNEIEEVVENVSVNKPLPGGILAVKGGIKGNYTEEVESNQIVINKPVNWKKKVKSNKSLSNVEIKIPLQAENISVKKIVNNSEEPVETVTLIVEEGIYEKLVTEPVAKEQTVGEFIGNLITGNIIAIGPGSNETNQTGEAENQSNLSENQTIEETKTIVVGDDVDEVEISYQTPGPTAIEENIPNGKRVIVSSDIHYENILSYTSVPELPSGSIKLFRIDNGTRIPWSFNEYDSDESGLVDYIDWIVPSLSNDTYLVIIEIVNAMHLDENYGFISNIYNETKALDDVWSEKILHNEYVRITFKENLTNENDITVYARGGLFTQSYIEVHYYDSSEIITSFPVINEESLHQVLLTDMNGSHDTFDLRIKSLDNDSSDFLEFDYIVDPKAQAEPSGKRYLTVQKCNAMNVSTTKNNYENSCLGTYPAACGGGSADRLSCDDGFTEDWQYSRNTFGGIRANFTNTTITNCASVSEVFLCYEWWVTDTSSIQNCYMSVDANGGTSYNNVTTTCPGSSANPGLTCSNVTALETWTCGIFFGGGAKGALARSQVSRGAPAGTHTLKTDAMFFNVTFVENNTAPKVNLSAPANNSVYGVGTAVIPLKVNVTDDLIPENNVTLYIFGNKTGISTSDSLGESLLYKGNVTNGTKVEFNWSGYPFEVEEDMLFGFHFDNINSSGENNTHIYDWAGNYNGTVNGSFMINFSNDIFGGHIDFVGSNDYIWVQDCDYDCYKKTNKTFFAWLRPTSASGNRVIMAAWSTVASGFGLSLYRNGGDFRIGTDLAPLSLTIPGYFVENEWVHMAVVFREDQDEFDIYRNGIFNITIDSSILTISDVSAADNFKVGVLTDEADNVWFGSMDEVAVINRSMSAIEIAELVNLTKGTHYWYAFVNDSDASNTSEIREFRIGDDDPNITLNSPANNTNYTEVGSIVLNATVGDPEGNNLVVRIYGGNTTATDREDLIYYDDDASDASPTAYNWTSQVLDDDGDYLLLVHLDKNTHYGENNTHVFDFANATAQEGGNNGIITGSTLSINVSGGKLGGALRGLDNNNEYVNFSTRTEWAGVKNISYLIWYMPRDTTGEHGLLSDFDAPGSTGFGISRDSTNMRLKVVADSSSLTSSNNFFALDVWKHIAVVVNNSGGIAIYGDGALDAEGDISTISAGLEFIIGNQNTGAGAYNSPLNGHIDEVAIVNRSLNSTEINNSYRLKAGDYHWFVNVTDLTNNSVENETRRIRVDRIGIVTNITISPHNVANITNTTADLNCSFEAKDDLNTKATANIQFLKEGVGGGADTTFTLSDLTIGTDVINSQTMLAYKTYHFDNWSCNVTITDASFISDGSNGISFTNTSVNTTIENFVPLFPTLQNPLNGSTTTDRTPEFIWIPDNTYGQLPPPGASCSGFFCDGNTSDPDRDNVIYHLNLTCVIGAGGNCDDNQHILVMENEANCDSNGNGRFDNEDNCTFSPTNDLLYFFDDDNTYEWFIEAGDNYTNSTPHYGQTLANEMVVNISIDLGVTFLNHTVTFGSMLEGQNNLTDNCVLNDNGPGACPWWIENTGNVKANINITGISDGGLWSSLSSPDVDYFALKIGNGSQAGKISYVEADSQLSYNALPPSRSNSTIVVNFTKDDDNDELRIDFNITVPSGETSGNKSVSLDLTAYRAE